MKAQAIATIAALLATGLWLPHVTLAQASDAQAPLALAALEARVSQHPSVLRAAAAVEEARGLSRQAGKWDNPVVGFAADELRPRESPSGHLGGFVEQVFPVGGARGAAREAGESEVARREAELGAVRLGVLVGIRRSYYAVLAAEERVRVLERQRELASEAASVASQLFNIGLVDRSDVLLSEVESARAAARVAAAEAGRDGAWQALASAAADPELGPGALAVPFDAPVPVLAFEGVRDEIRRASPVLQVAEAAVRRARAVVAFAETIARPNLFTRGDFGWNRELIPSATSARAIGWEFGVELGVSLPIADRNTSGIAAAGATVTAAEAEVAEIRLRLDARTAELFSEYDSARRAVEAYRDEVLPRAGEAYELYMARYREMAAPYPSVLAAARTLAEMNEEYLDAVARARDAAVRLQGLLVDGGT